MNFQQLQEHVVTVTGRRDKAALVQTELNWALDEIFNRTRFDFFRVIWEPLVLQNGQASIDLPADWKEIERVTIIKGPTYAYDLDFRSQDWVLNQYPVLDGSKTGSPIVCFLNQSKLQIFPSCNVSDMSLRLIYRRWHRKLVSPEDNIEIPGLDAATCSWAIAGVYQSIGSLQEHASWMMTFEKQLASRVAASQHQAASRYAKDVVSGQRMSISLDGRNPMTNPFVRTVR